MNQHVSAEQHGWQIYQKSKSFKGGIRPVFLNIVGALLIILAAGCSTKETYPPLPHAMPVDPPPGSDMLTSNTFAGDALSSMLLQRIGAENGILVTTMVNMEGLDSSSPFGRTAMQQISSRVAQHGFKVTEVRLTAEMRMELRGGEFMLSRDTARLLSRDHDAHAVLVGIYSRAGSRLFISTRVIRLSDNTVIAAYEYYMPLTGDTRYLLGQSSDPDSKGSSDSVWRQYAARGQAFPNQNMTTQERFVGGESVEDRVGRGGSSGSAAPAARSSGSKKHSPKTSQSRAAVVPTSAGVSAIPYGSAPPAGGVPIDPNAAPKPIGNKQR